MELRLIKLDSGVLMEVYQDGELIKRHSGTGKWNIFPIISKYLFEENSKKLKKSPAAKKKRKL